jgi:hypothetical protein
MRIALQRALPCFAAISIILALIGCSSRGLEVGNKLPDLTFYDLDGNKVKIYDYIKPGKILLLHLWGAACCLTYSVPTSKAVGEIAAHEGQDWVTVVSVNLDYPIPKVRRIVKEQGFIHTMLNDKDGSYYRAEPGFKLFFPLAIILAVDDKGIIRAAKLKGHQLTPAIRELLELARAEKE